MLQHQQNAKAQFRMEVIWGAELKTRPLFAKRELISGTCAGKPYSEVPFGRKFGQFRRS